MRSSLTRRRRGGAIAIAVGLMAAGLVAAPTALAQSDVDTSANVGGGSAAPIIECSWALNDSNHNWTDFMNYGLDDAPSNVAGFPCIAAGDAATQADGAFPTIQVRPNASDLPTEAYVELWAAVDSNNPAATIVYFDVDHPDGTQKTQVEATLYASSSQPANCEGPAGMFDAAAGNGLITAQARSNIVAECKFQQKGLYYAAFGISKHQPHGKYNIEVHAATAGGQESILNYGIEVLSFYQLEKDFTEIGFGAVTANSHFWQDGAGNFVWDGVDNATNTASTVRNTGNAGVGLSVRFSSMCLVGTANPSTTGCTDAKRIDHFDAKFGAREISNMQAIGSTNIATSLTSNLGSTANPAPPGAWYNFDDTLGRVLCPNDTGKVEFSIWTEGIQVGEYRAPGGIGLMARPVPLCPTDNGSAYLFNGYTGVTPISNSHH